MTFPLQNSLRTPWALAMLVLACSLSVGTASAQPDEELRGMTARAVEAAISGMNRANGGRWDIRYDGQPGAPGV